MTGPGIGARRCLSVVMPCFNEESTVGIVLDRVLASPWVAEVVVVDDGSTDRSTAVVAACGDPRVASVVQPSNAGKGAALRLGLSLTTSEYVVVQDADLEYDPADYGRLLEPLEAGVADAVFGSRFASGRRGDADSFWHRFGNRVLTRLSNASTGLGLTDMETCYKAFRREIVQSIDLRENRFGFEPEITAKLAALRCRIVEVGISYHGRTHRDGKKIGWRDGVSAIACILRYSPFLTRLTSRRQHRSTGSSNARHSSGAVTSTPTSSDERRSSRDHAEKGLVTPRDEA